MLSNKKIWLMVFLILLGSSLSILLVYTKIDTYCVSFILLVILMPFLATRFLLEDLQSHFQRNQGAVGALIGATTGFFPVTVLITVAIITITSNPIEQTTAYSKLSFGMVIASLVGTWFALMVVSTIAGLIASIRPVKKE
jgi:hypothetical protein